MPPPPTTFPVSYRGSGSMHLACAVSCAVSGLPHQLPLSVITVKLVI